MFTIVCTDQERTVMGEAKFHLDDKLYNQKLSNPKSKIYRKYSQEIKDEVCKPDTMFIWFISQQTWHAFLN